MITRLQRAFFTVLLFCYAPGLGALENAGETGAPAVPSVWKALGALLLVLGLVLVLAWLAKRFLPFLPQAALRDSKDIRLVAVKSLGPKKSLVLVEVEGRRLLVGVSDSGVTLIQDFRSATADKTLTQR